MKVLLTVSILGMLATAPAFADCTAPDGNVQIPNGASATRDEMIAGQKAVKAYDAAVKAFSECVQQDADAKIAAGGDKAKITKESVERSNTEVDKLQKVADKFNVELKAYKAKNAG